MKYLKWMFGLVLLFFFAAIFEQNVAFAQKSASCEISGVIKDSTSNEALPYATIMIKGTATGTITDLDGNFRFANLQSGNYTLRITYTGYSAQEVAVNLNVGEKKNVSVKLNQPLMSVGEVIVSSQRMGQNAAISQQLNSNALVNVISKDRIREIPDVNAAEAIGRLPGISLVRTQGEGSKVIIRGLDPKFSTVSINGVKQASTNSDDRSVDLSGISPELLSGVEVYKSPTADMDGDAIGGTVNLIIAKAPDITKNQIRVYGGYASLNKKMGNFKGSWDYSTRLLNKKLGVMAQVTYEKLDRSAQGIERSYHNPDNDKPDSLFISTVKLTNRTQETKRMGGNLFLDYQFSWGSIYLTNMYNASPKTSFIQQKTVNRTGLVTQDYTSNENKSNAFNTTLGGKVNLNFAKIDWSLNRVQSNVYNPYALLMNFELPAPSGLANTYAGINTNDVNEIMNNLAFTSTNLKKDSSSYIRNVTWTPDTLKQTNYSAKIDIEIPIKISDDLGGFVKIGGKYSSEKRKKIIVNYIDAQYYLNTRGIVDSAVARELRLGNKLLLNPDRRIALQNFTTPGATNIMNGDYEFWPAADESKIKAWKDNHFMELVSDPSTIETAYESTEIVGAAYVMLKLNYKDLITFVPGLRYEVSDNSYQGYNSTIAGAMGVQGYYEKAYSRQNYSELLPSAHLKIKPIEGLDFRFSAVKTISRPNYQWLIPWFHYNSGNYTVSKGNPDLKYATSWNYDASATVFSNNIGLISIGGYYKKINNMFYKTTGTLRAEEAVNFNLPPQAFDLNEDYINLDNSWVKGLEFEVNTHFNFLPSPFNRIALGLNATRLWSQTFYLVWKKYESLVMVNNVRPILTVDFNKSHYEQAASRMPSQVDFTCNSWIGYDYKGFSGRVSMSYQGTRLTGVNAESLDPASNVYSDNYLRFDASLKQKVNKYISVLLNLNNITNTPEKGYRYQSSFPTYNNLYGMTFELGVQISMQ